MGLFQKLFGRKKAKSQNMSNIDHGTFLADLDKHMLGLQVDLSSPPAVKIGVFIVVTTNVARASAGFKPIDGNTPFNENNALVIVIQEGIRALVSAKHPQLSEDSDLFKADIASILAITADKVFEYEPRNNDERMRGILNMGIQATRRAQNENGALLRQIFGQWEVAFKDYSVENVSALGDSYRVTVDWLNKRKMT